LVDAGEEVLHVFLEPDATELRGRLSALVARVENPGANQSAREWALSRIEAAIPVAARQPNGTLMLRSDRGGTGVRSVALRASRNPPARSSDRR
jgi:hypothetical protein